MAGNVYLWSTTALTNATADTDINWAEGQFPSSVNNSARALMAGVAGWLKDTNGTLTTGGSANAQTVTANVAYAALATGIVLRFKAGASNTAAATLTVTPAGGAAFAAKAIRVFTSGGDSALVANMIRQNGDYEVVYDTAANSAAGAWILTNPTTVTSAGKALSESFTSLNGVAGAPSISVVTQKFTASGTYTPTTGMIHCIIECMGGGAGGGSSQGDGGSLTTYGGAGGGSGSYARKYASAATIGASQTVTIGAGGAGGAAGSNNGSAGGDTSVGSLCIGKGGSGGQYGSVANCSAGGAGGVAGTGDFTPTGASGGGSVYQGTTSVNMQMRGGHGGSSLFGGGGVGTQNATGGAGGLYGGGGAGSSAFNTGSNFAGGAGAAGVVVITEFVLA